ncbi:DNA-3-methyladenine glycosylase 1 [subsurface metagenome]
MAELASNTKSTCSWPSNNPLMIEYHDKEWGTPVHDDRKHFEFFVLDLFQAGLSWQIVLKKREGFREALDNFDFEKIALYNEQKIQELIMNEKIIRNQLKIRATITNAQKFLEIREEFGSFDDYIWQFVNHKPIHNQYTELSQLPASTRESDAMSKDLKKRGFKFVGTTICYAYMQAAGMMNDHMTYCFRYKEWLCFRKLWNTQITISIFN